MSYELHEDGSLTPLPENNIDTGMGLERMAAILQGVGSVFETDAFRPLIDLAEELSGRSYDDDQRDHAGDADHRRPLPRDDLPDRRRRGAVQRGPRLRPAAGHAPRDPAGPGRWGSSRPGWARFAERAIEMMADAYPELAEHRETIIRWVADEEEAFGRTLDRGTELLARLVAEAKDQETSWIDAEDAFKLHDTYGFPYDLTKELLAEEGLSVDDSGLRGADGAAAPAGAERRGGSRPDRHEAVISFASAAPASTFVGYETLHAETAVLAAEELPGNGTPAWAWSSSRRAPSIPRAAARSPTPA